MLFSLCSTPLPPTLTHACACFGLYVYVRMCVCASSQPPFLNILLPVPIPCASVCVHSPPVLNILFPPLAYPVQVCVFTAPLFSAFCALASYGLVREVRGPGAGLLASAFVGMVPSYISRSVAGSYDNEGVAIFALVNVFYLFVKVCVSARVCVCACLCAHASVLIVRL